MRLMRNVPLRYRAVTGILASPDQQLVE